MEQHVSKTPESPSFTIWGLKKIPPQFPSFGGVAKILIFDGVVYPAILFINIILNTNKFSLLIKKTSTQL